ncbi:unknown [Methanothermobacter thermautotrophicus str. Delta H]|uniref:Uncharacterized protein n=1 Tax=Methanothermobacter thermautotrophicus (strain ATCC 29096 / DSM 1053 / JCM 10044 / NBRC 100330 / Delta H) TaxID=187420 RepID=O26863_METTH|nr:hypothetical protein [Methanothermobacter thermautotrophicus]AAB85272.1 unknown [Methanothermobacter thermautotrophicus str. Delta H]
MNKYWGVAFLIFLAISLGTASAATENDTWSRWGSKGNHSHIKATSNCCSVIVNVNDTCAVFAYRRDSTYAATLKIQRTVWNGRETLKEYKTTNGYFFHTVISEGGWMMGAGGPDIVWINRALESIGGDIIRRGNVTSYDMKRAHSLVRRLGLGHFVIRGPGGQAGVSIYRRGYSRLSVFRLKSGEYLSVPNSPSYYRRGYYSRWSRDPLKAAVYAAGTDRWGINRRNILLYETRSEKNSTSVKVHVTFDGGRLIGRYRGRPDNILFLGKYISASSIPRIPTTRFLGTVTLARRIN